MAEQKAIKRVVENERLQLASGARIGGEKARLVQDDPTLLKVTAEISMTPVQQVLSQGQIAAAERALEQLQNVPPPSPPSAAYLTNPLGLSDRRLEELAELGTDDAQRQLAMVRDDLVATLAEHQSTDRRNAVVRALRQRLAFVQALLAHCHCQGPPEET
jgi:hypothetical protein